MIFKTINFFEKRKKLSLTITTLIAIFIFYMSSLNFSSGSGNYEWNLLCVAYHFFVFFALNFFLLLSFSEKISFRRKNLKYFFIIISISLIYAALDEIHQYFVPGRFATFNDFLIDSAGILISSLFYISIKNFKK